MKDHNPLLTGAVAGLLALGFSAASVTAHAPKEGFEKCAGVVKVGKNDCGTSMHACAGQATKSSAKEEWVYVPTGTCEKIVGATVYIPAKK